MNPSAFRHRVTIQARVDSVDDTTGVLTVTWTPLASVWAHVRPMTTREQMAAGKEEGKASVMVDMRYRSDILPSMRIAHGEHTYNIGVPIADARTGNQWLTLPVSEVVDG